MRIVDNYYIYVQLLLFQSERGGKPKVESLGKSELYRVLCSINILLFVYR